MLFVGFLERIKQELDLKKDKDVAAFLGLEAKAFSIRKKRDSIPVDAVRAAAFEHPDLDVDWSYILTGRRDSLKSRLPEKQMVLSVEEKKLVSLFRQASELGQAVIMSAAKGAEKKEETNVAANQVG